MNYYISIDGGGTKTEGVTVDQNGHIVLRNKVGSSNPTDLGAETAIKVVADLVLSLIPKDATCVRVAVGGSGMKTGGLEQPLKDRLSAIGSVEEVVVLTDVLTAFYSAYDGVGSILIIGTGCVGYVSNGTEGTFIGGGGHFFDRLFSGFDLGREVVNAVLEAEDGRGDKTLLTDLFVAKAGVSARAHIKELYDKGKAYVASFAPLVFNAYEQGDKVAKAILERCACDLEKLLLAMHVKSGDKVAKITVFGGLNAKLNTIKKFLSSTIKEKVELIMPKNPIIFGGVKLVANVDDAFTKNFLSDY